MKPDPDDLYVFGRGPWVAAALLCERVLVEEGGVLSPIRIIDRLTVNASGPATPPDMPQGKAKFTVLIILKGGETRGSYPLRLNSYQPSGEQTSSSLLTVAFDGGAESGAALVIETELDVVEPGLYRFDALFGDDGKLLARIPLRVLYHRTEISGAQPG